MKIPKKEDCRSERHTREKKMTEKEKALGKEPVEGKEKGIGKKIYLGTNTKMYKTIGDTCTYLKALKDLTADISEEQAELFVIPSFTSLAAAREILQDSGIRLGAQNMCWEDQGQFTGEISPLMLKELAIDLVEIGHSERRHVFGETDQEERKKVTAAVRHGFQALLCVGETLEQKEYGISDEVLRMQLKVGLHDMTAENGGNLMIAYEPVWAIGVHGIPAGEEYVNQRHRVMKQTLKELLGEEAAWEIPVLYGGSVNPGNAVPLMRQPYVDGLFIGRSAWDAHDFNRLIRSVLEAQA